MRALAHRPVQAAATDAQESMGARQLRLLLLFIGGGEEPCQGERHGAVTTASDDLEEGREL